MWGMIALAVLFNPLAPIHINRDTWQVVDVTGGCGASWRSADRTRRLNAIDLPGASGRESLCGDPRKMIVCQACQTNPAGVHLTEIKDKDKQKREIHLCTRCAQENGISIKADFSLGEIFGRLFDPAGSAPVQKEKEREEREKYKRESLSNYDFGTKCQKVMGVSAFIWLEWAFVGRHPLHSQEDMSPAFVHGFWMAMTIAWFCNIMRRSDQRKDFEKALSDYVEGCQERMPDRPSGQF